MSEWVALRTFANDDDGAVPELIEAGGVYSRAPQINYARVAGEAGRDLVDGEHVVECPRCGQRFADTEEDTAESHRNLHFDGDEDAPSICKQMPTRRPTRVK